MQMIPALRALKREKSPTYDGWRFSNEFRQKLQELSKTLPERAAAASQQTAVDRYEFTYSHHHHQKMKVKIHKICWSLLAEVEKSFFFPSAAVCLFSSCVYDYLGGKSFSLLLSTKNVPRLQQLPFSRKEKNKIKFTKYRNFSFEINHPIRGCSYTYWVRELYFYFIWFVSGEEEKVTWREGRVDKKDFGSDMIINILVLFKFFDSRELKWRHV